jgi:hypothetical protein
MKVKIHSWVLNEKTGNHFLDQTRYAFDNIIHLSNLYKIKDFRELYVINAIDVSGNIISNIPDSITLYKPRDWDNTEFIELTLIKGD